MPWIAAVRLLDSPNNQVLQKGGRYEMKGFECFSLSDVSDAENPYRAIYYEDKISCQRVNFQPIRGYWGSRADWLCPDGRRLMQDCLISDGRALPEAFVLKEDGSLYSPHGFRLEIDPAPVARPVLESASPYS